MASQKDMLFYEDIGFGPSRLIGLHTSKLIRQKLEKIETTLHTIIDNENKEKLDNTCPICMESCEMNNYLVPLCGHKLCLPCFTNNIIKNNRNGNKCSICRMEILKGL